jgi:hypothetical protein
LNGLVCCQFENAKPAHVAGFVFWGAGVAVQQFRAAIYLRCLAVMTREQTASNGYYCADDRERVKKEDEAMTQCAVFDEAVDQVGHVEFP